jgi:hypothetical protein
MTEETKTEPEIIPIIPLVKLVAIVIFTIGMIFFVTPWFIERMQSESGVCGKEFHNQITYISSLKSDKNVGGTFFLGIGSVRTERVYVAYTGNNRVGYVLVERPISKSLLFEDTNETPYIDEVDVWTCTSMGYYTTKQYRFHVPEGTIKMEYAV